jgi:hypothetical protein
VYLVAISAANAPGILLCVASETAHTAELSPRPGDSGQTKNAPTQHLAGVVRDAEGRPVAGATVVAGQFAGGEPNHRIATTDSNGRFELTPAGKSASLDYAVAHKDGLAPASFVRFLRHDSADEEPGNVALQLGKTAPFVGVVKDSQGNPVAAATARIQFVQYSGSDGPATGLAVIEHIVRGSPLERIFRTTTDTQGRFVFPALPGGAKVSIVVTAAGMGEFNSGNRTGPDGQMELLSGTAAQPAIVVLAPGARVAGRIVTRIRGIKVSGLKVAMQGSQHSHAIWAEAETDAAGRFEFTGVAEGTANVFLKDDKSDGLWTYRAAADIALRPGQATDVTIELIRGVRVEGRVTDGRDGIPVAGLGIGMYGPMRPRSGAAIVVAKTDKDGWYRFRLPPGPTYLYAYGPLPAEFGQRVLPGRNIDIPLEVQEFTVPTMQVQPELQRADLRKR